MSNESTSSGAGIARNKFSTITELEDVVRRELQLRLARLEKRAERRDGAGILVS